MTSFIDEESLKRTLSVPAGRKVLWGILAAAGVFRQPFSGGDQNLTSFNCGSLNVGLILYADCMQCSPDLTAMMTKEQGNVDNGKSAASGNGADNSVADRVRTAVAGLNSSDAAGDHLGLGFDRSGH